MKSNGHLFQSGMSNREELQLAAEVFNTTERNAIQRLALELSFYSVEAPFAYEGLVLPGTSEIMAEMVSASMLADPGPDRFVLQFIEKYFIFTAGGR